MDSYGGFASLYDELMNDFDYEEWAKYIEEIYKRYNLKPKDILEMACGTGNLSYYLAKKRYNLVCFDLSQEMLTKAYEKLGRFNNVKILNQNMINFNINKKFDSVISICDSMNYITTDEELANCFKNVYNHLKPNGIFIFDINSYYKLKNIIGNNTFIEDREDIFYTWQNYYDNNKDICEFYLTFFEENKEGLYSRFDEVHIERAYKEDFICEKLLDVGFTKIDFYNAFTFNKKSDSDERVNFIAIK
ncbi:class I SAM-dependent methyltransferase [Tissierella sp. Yu-01]|uniref:class I SAM-dependent DNA methyltransferase n=1 Tax=Tissierella sp. Yu-01 TaxID=3035694 RepID=UPI00240E55AE|nr:class I SAM-dependent methyltransferase [Tissierella sp. Yu-01]WFA09892.1 class I SAM-dependent methyltransferase [Tissierella sp. Yu-01]